MTDQIKFLGDVHLGKPFKNGVPLHRRGDRARIQWDEFERNLNEVQGVRLHVQVGDLFDEAVVPYGVIYRAAQAYKRAADAHPNTEYAVLRGNHDASKDVEKVTAFMLFTEMLRETRILVVDDQVSVLYFGSEHVALIPWHPVFTAGEMILRDEALIRDATKAVGHWDVVMGGTNQIPSETLKALGVKEAFTGHDHNARQMELDGLPITIVGSMQPYSHSEDRDERFYVTRDLADVLADLDGFKDKHLRVRLQGDEVFDADVDCLQLTLTRDGQEHESVSMEVDFEAFDMKTLFGQAMEAAGASGMVEMVWTRLQDGQMGDQ